MNAVIDEDLPRSLGTILSNLGFTVFDIRDYALRGSSDEKIFQFAQKQKAVLFSADLGFSNIINFPLGSHSGIVVLRFPNDMIVSEINKEIGRLLNELSSEDYNGSFIVVSPGRIRIRRHNQDKN